MVHTVPESMLNLYTKAWTGTVLKPCTCPSRDTYITVYTWSTGSILFKCFTAASRYYSSSFHLNVMLYTADSERGTELTCSDMTGVGQDAIFERQTILSSMPTTWIAIAKLHVCVCLL